MQAQGMLHTTHEAGMPAPHVPLGSQQSQLQGHSAAAVPTDTSEKKYSTVFCPCKVSGMRNSWHPAWQKQTVTSAESSPLCRGKVMLCAWSQCLGCLDQRGDRGCRLGHSKPWRSLTLLQAKNASSSVGQSWPHEQSHLKSDSVLLLAAPSSAAPSCPSDQAYILIPDAGLPKGIQDSALICMLRCVRPFIRTVPFPCTAAPGRWEGSTSMHILSQLLLHFT